VKAAAQGAGGGGERRQQSTGGKADREVGNLRSRQHAVTSGIKPGDVVANSSFQKAG
jgi:hypothetical protein